MSAWILRQQSLCHSQFGCIIYETAGICIDHSYSDVDCDELIGGGEYAMGDLVLEASDGFAAFSGKNDAI